jgi:hypothetical protein
VSDVDRKKKRDETNFVRTDMRSKKNEEKKENDKASFSALPRSHTGSINNKKKSSNVLARAL